MPRKVTAEDKEAAQTDLMPYYGKGRPEDFAVRKIDFGQARDLLPVQVDSIILELRHKASLKASAKE